MSTRKGRARFIEPVVANLLPTPEHRLPSGGRTWWAHFEFSRIDLTLTILRKKIEERLDTRGSDTFFLPNLLFGTPHPVSQVAQNLRNSR